MQNKAVICAKNGTVNKVDKKINIKSPTSFLFSLGIFGILAIYVVLT